MNLRRQENILLNCPPWEKHRRLEHEARYRWRLSYRCSCDMNASTRRLEKSGDEIEKGRFTATAATDERHKPPTANGNINPIKGNDRLSIEGEGLRELARLDDGRSGVPLRPKGFGIWTHGHCFLRGRAAASLSNLFAPAMKESSRMISMSMSFKSAPSSSEPCRMKSW